ncbi:MAG: MarR family transcriptional regulator [Spirochaetales bacterium]|nr:MarR family transcriptional regulator [Spirochaetales bacterium]
MEYEQLKLENQVCFPLYAASRLITRTYQPLLEELGLTYPQYLVLMVLWNKEGLTVNAIAEKLILNTNTITPLLKRMQENGILTRERAKEDERKVIINLTEEGRNLRHKAALVPEKLVKTLKDADLTNDELFAMKKTLYKLIEILDK